MVFSCILNQQQLQIKLSCVCGYIDLYIIVKETDNYVRDMFIAYSCKWKLELCFLINSLWSLIDMYS